MNVLVIGGSGLLGNKLVELLRKNDEFTTYATYHHTSVNKSIFFHLDITDQHEIDAVFGNVNPEIVILCSAFTDVDGCEQHKEQAYQINVTGTERVAKKVEAMNAKLVYVSTDYVFDGQKGNYIEKDSVNPINYYGKTKLLGEKKVKAYCSDFLICRTSVIYGVNKSNFAMWLIDQLSNERLVRIVNDQKVSTTYNTDLSEQIIALLKQKTQGIYHTTGASQLSRYEFSLALATVFGFNTQLITSVQLKDFNWVADRPKDSTLNVSKISQVKKPFEIKKALTLFKKEYDSIKNKEE